MVSNILKLILLRGKVYLRELRSQAKPPVDRTARWSRVPGWENRSVATTAASAWPGGSATRFWTPAGSRSVPAFTLPACTSGTAGGSFLSDELEAGLPTLAVVRAGVAYTEKWEGRSP